MANLMGFSASVVRERSVTEQGALRPRKRDDYGPRDRVRNWKAANRFGAAYALMWVGPEPGSIYGFELWIEAWRTRDDAARILTQARRHHREASKCDAPSRD